MAQLNVCCHNKKLWHKQSCETWEVRGWGADHDMLSTCEKWGSVGRLSTPAPYWGGSGRTVYVHKRAML